MTGNGTGFLSGTAKNQRPERPGVPGKPTRTHGRLQEESLHEPFVRPSRPGLDPTPRALLQVARSETTARITPLPGASVIMLP